jgi:molybdopterin-guanine dinucleotide biosynthesis protein A
MPFLTDELVGYLLGLLSASVPAAVPYLGGRPQPLCSAYRREIQPIVSAALDRDVRAVREFLEDLPGVLYVGEKELTNFGEPELLLTSVNSPEDLARARAALRDIAPGRS